VANRKPEIYYI